MPQKKLEGYETVSERRRRFLKAYPDAVFEFAILTPIAEIRSHVLMKCSIYREKPVGLSEMSVIMPDSVGHAHEIAGTGFASQDAWVENCETSALGRALANIGYSGDDKCSREEMEKVERAQKRKAKDSKPPKRQKIDGVDLLHMFEAKRGEWNTMTPADRKKAFHAWARGYEMRFPKGLPEEEKTKAKTELGKLMLKKLSEADSDLDYDVNQDGENVDPQTGEVVENQDELARQEEGT